MTRLISVLFALAAFAAPLSVFANSFKAGEVLSHSLSVCLKKSDAVAIVNAHAKDGIEAANKVWDAANECRTVNVVGPQVGKVVHSVKVDKNKRASVVEIVNDGKVLAYFVTTLPVDTDRNT
jgi:hypothetical protein